MSRAQTAVEKYQNAWENENIIISELPEYISTTSRTEKSKTYSVTKLWEVDSNAVDSNNGITTGHINFSQSINNFDEIIVTGQAYNSTNNTYNQTNSLRILKANYYPPDLNPEYGVSYNLNIGTPSYAGYISFTFSDDGKSLFTTTGGIYKSRLINVYGINY